MGQTGLKTQTAAPLEPAIEEIGEDISSFGDLGPTVLARVRLLWENRQFLIRAALAGLCAGLLLAFLIPARYTARQRIC